MVGRRAVVVDTETTSLFPNYDTGSGVIWEVGAIEYGDQCSSHLYRMEPDPSKADPGALQVNRYYEATRLMRRRDKRVHDLAGGDVTARGGCWSDPAGTAYEVARLLDGVTLIAANPTFDANYLSAFFAAYGQSRQPWHYRLRDIGSMAWAYCQSTDAPTAMTPDMDASTDDFARALGIDPDRFERHSALGDCRLVVAMLDVMLGESS